LPGEFPFCPYCGEPTSTAPVVEPARERKVVTVLFCDVVGFTSASEGADPEDVREQMQGYYARVRQEIESFGGTVEKYIGDAVMAVFGAPVSHEDDAERAVRTGLRLVEAANELDGLAVRVGVNTGEVLVMLDARPELGEGIVLGDVVNTAARIQTFAPMGGVAVSESTYTPTKHAFDYEPLGTVSPKGKSEPLELWLAAAARARPGGRQIRATNAPIVGRERELALLAGTLDRAEVDRRPQLVTLVGVPGIGKSRLVQELVRSHFSEEAGRAWLQGRCLPYGDGVSFWAVAEIVKAQAGIFERDDPAVVAEKLSAAVRDVVAGAEIARVTGALLPLVGLEADAANASDERDETFAAWLRFLESVAARKPLMVVIEDLHWADDGLLDFVDYLAGWASDVQLLIVCTTRPELLERRPGWGGGKLNALTLGLSPLGDEDAARLIAGVLDRAVLPAETLAALLARAEGNPLYAEQFALLFLEGGTDDLPLPQSVHGLIAARIDALPHDEKALLQDAAVVGRSFWSGALPTDDLLDDHLHNLERKEFIREEWQSSVAGENEYTFRHALVRDVAYGQIPRPDRSRKHQFTAEWIESLGRPQDHAELLAHHYAAALELATASGLQTAALVPRARDALRDAGDRALSLSAFVAAQGFYQQALALTSDGDPARPLLLFRIGEVRFNNEQADYDVLVEAAGALREAGSLQAASEAEVMLAHVAWGLGQEGLAFRHFERASQLIDRIPEGSAQANVLNQRTRHSLLVTGDRGLLSVIRASFGDMDGALDDTARALELARKSDDPHPLWSALGVRAWILSEAGRPAEAEALLDEILADTRTPEAGRFFRGHPLVLWVAREAGRTAELLDWMTRPGARPSRWLEAAEAMVADDLIRAADLYGAGGHRPLDAFIRLRASRSLAAQGRTADAEAHVKLALVYFRAIGVTRYVAEGTALLASLEAAG
jgi:class 3 adenylate cyclase